MLGSLAPFSLDLWLLGVGIVTGLATICGGVAALRFASKLDLFRAFSSGAVLGVALFDLLPEAFDLGRPAHAPLTLTTATAVGFAAYFIADRLPPATTNRPPAPRDLAPASLTAHSLMDGLGIGLAFQVSVAIGLILTFAVLAHDFVDGANTVTLSLSGGGSPARARRWLVADAAAPLVGIAASRLVAVPPATLATLLALFAGFFLYIGARELPPSDPDARPRLAVVGATALGLGFIYAVVRLAS